MTQIENKEAGDSVRAKINAALGVTDLVKVYDTRQEFVDAVNEGLIIDDGGIVSASGVNYLADSSSVAIPDLEGFVPFGDVTPDHWIENVNPGTTDVSAASQSAVDYLATLPSGGCLVLRSNNVYRFDSSVTISAGNIRVIAHGASISAAATLGPENQNQPDGVFRFVGEFSASTTLASDASQGDTSVSVSSATGIEAGQVIRFFNAQSGVGFKWYTEDSTTVFRSFISRVTNVTGTTITISDQLPFDFDATTFTCVIQTWEGLQNCGIEGGSWDGGGYDHPLDNGKGTAVAYSICCQNLSIDIEQAKGFSGATLWASYTYGLTFNAAYIEGHRDGYSDPIVEGTNSGFFGVRVDDCRGCVIGGFTSNRVRHTTDGTRTWDTVIHDIIAINNHRPPFGSHNGCSNWQHSSLSTRGPNGGALWRGFNCTFDGLFVDSPNDSEPAFYDTVGAPGDLRRSYQLSNFRTNMGRESIRLEADIDTCIVNGGYHKGAIENSVYSAILVNTPRMNSFQMNGGAVVGDSSILVDFATGATERDSVSFNGTEFRDYTTSAVRCQSVTGETTLNASNCYFVPNGATNHVDASGTFENLRRDGFVQGAGLYQPDNEGEWVPILGDASSDATHTTQVGEWRRDGDRVHVSGRVTISSKGSVAGSLLIKFNDLPFVIRSGTYAGGVVTFATGLTLPSAASVTLRALSGGSEFGLYVWEGAGGPNTMVSTDISDTTTMYFEATFVV